MNFSDLHMHALYGVDDGAKTELEMTDLIDAAYKDGTRYMCLTPHCHPGYFADNHKEIDFAYNRLFQYVTQTYPDLSICLGNELRYAKECISWLREGFCRTLNNSHYVLVDFSYEERADYIAKSLNSLLNAGYTPVLAHPERYVNIPWKMKEFNEFKTNGVLFQVNAQSLLGSNGFMEQQRAKRIIEKGFADFISSDAHNLTKRPPGLSKVYEYLLKKYGKQAAEDLCFYNARSLLWPENTDKEDK